MNLERKIGLMNVGFVDGELLAASFQTEMALDMHRAICRTGSELGEAAVGRYISEILQSGCFDDVKEVMPLFAVLAKKLDEKPAGGFTFTIEIPQLKDVKARREKASL